MMADAEAPAFQHTTAGPYTSEQVESWCPVCHPKPKPPALDAASLQWQLDMRAQQQQGYGYGLGGLFGGLQAPSKRR